MKEIVKTILYFIGFIIFKNYKSKIIYYHDIHQNNEERYTDMSTPISLIKKHIDIAIKSNYKFVNTITKETGQIMITFDDGFKGIYDNQKFFISRNIYPTIFIAVELIGSKNYMNLEEIIELKNKGFKFQSHTVSHQNLTKFEETELIHELSISKKELSELLNYDVCELCFPQGYFSDLVIEKSFNIGYSKLYSSIPGTTTLNSTFIHRNCVQFVSPLQFKFIIGGGMKILQKHYINLHYIGHA